MYTAREYAFITPTSMGRRRYRSACRRLDLRAVPEGYGALLCRDGDGREVTMLTTEVDYLRMVVDSVSAVHDLRCGEPGTADEPAVTVPGEKFAISRSGDLGKRLGTANRQVPGRRRRRSSTRRGEGSA